MTAKLQGVSLLRGRSVRLKQEMNRNGLWVCKCTYVARGNIVALLFRTITATLKQERRNYVLSYFSVNDS
jgi:hypothetical protein